MDLDDQQFKELEEEAEKMGVNFKGSGYRSRSSSKRKMVLAEPVRATSPNTSAPSSASASVRLSGRPRKSTLKAQSTSSQANKPRIRRMVVELTRPAQQHSTTADKNPAKKLKKAEQELEHSREEIAEVQKELAEAKECIRSTLFLWCEGHH
jgi:hypothetical protein